MEVLAVMRIEKMKPANETRASGAAKTLFAMALVYVLASVPGAAQTSFGTRTHIWRSQLSATVLQALDAVGDRLNRAGRERMSLEGTINWPVQKRSFRVRIVRENPDLLYAAIGDGADAAEVRFDGSRLSSLGSIAAEQTGKLLRLVVDDSVEAFFFARARGYATRYLGRHFGSSRVGKEIVGPYYSVYLSWTPEPLVKGTTVNKAYYFNSETKLLEYVAYTSAKQDVLVSFGDWCYVDGQAIPKRIVRSESGAVIMEIVVSGISFGPAVTDGLFVAH
jgi:hypothetical protein